MYCTCVYHFGWGFPCVFSKREIPDCADLLEVQFLRWFGQLSLCTAVQTPNQTVELVRMLSFKHRKV